MEANLTLANDEFFASSFKPPPELVEKLQEIPE
jgi:hypothetical protein